MNRADLLARRLDLTRAYQDGSLPIDDVRARIQEIDHQLADMPAEKPPIAKRWRRARPGKIVKEID